MSDIALIDANVLIYAVDIDFPYHETAKEIRDLALFGKIECCLCPQVLLEFFSVSTNPRRVFNPVSTQDALAEIQRYLNSLFIRMIYPPPDGLKGLLKLYERYSVQSQEIFDLYLIVTMLANNVRNVYTFDDTVFRKFKEIEVLIPR